MKKKILTLALVVVMIAIMLTSFTMAYFTDDDKATNTFTIGNVDIEVVERTTNENGQLVAMPAEGGNVPNALFPVKKEVGSTYLNKVVDTYNMGRSEAYVRTIIFIEDMPNVELEDVATVHLGITTNAKTTAGGITTFGASEGIAINNAFTVNGITYDVRIFDTAAKEALQPGDRLQSLRYVYLDENVTQEMIQADEDVLADGLQVYVLSQGIQTEGFKDYDEAMATFGELNADSCAEWFADAGFVTVADGE